MLEGSFGCVVEDVDAGQHATGLALPYRATTLAVGASSCAAARAPITARTIGTGDFNGGPAAYYVLPCHLVGIASELARKREL